MKLSFGLYRYSRQVDQVIYLLDTLHYCIVTLIVTVQAVDEMISDCPEYCYVTVGEGRSAAEQERLGQLSGNVM